MGMYDTVIAHCPKCGRDIEFQSKTGPCELDTYRIGNIPPDVAGGLNGRIVRCKCGTAWKFVVQTVTSVVAWNPAWDNDDDAK